jgi:ADP-ribose pyrophosphatase
MKPVEKMTDRVVGKTPVFSGHYLRTETWRMRSREGEEFSREIVRVPDSVALLPLDQNHEVVLVRQIRQAIRKQLVEIPAGLIDPGEKPLEAALRECEEETGYRPGRIIPLLRYAHAEGYSTAMMTLYLGLDLVHTGRIHRDATERIEVVRQPFAELVRWVMEGRILDSKTILAVLLSRPRVENP